MSKASRSSSVAGSSRLLLASTCSVTVVFRSARCPSASAIAARSGSRVGPPRSNSTAAASSLPGDGQRRQAARGGPQQFLISGIRDRELERVASGRLTCDPQLLPSRQIAAAIDGLRGSAGRCVAASASTVSAALVADPPDRQDRVVLERPFERATSMIGCECVAPPCSRPALRSPRAEQVLAAHHEAGHGLRGPWDRSAWAASARVSAGRTNSVSSRSRAPPAGAARARDRDDARTRRRPRRAADRSDRRSP